MSLIRGSASAGNRIAEGADLKDDVMILIGLADLQGHVDGGEETVRHVRCHVVHHAVDPRGRRLSEFQDAAIPAGDAVSNLAPTFAGDEEIQFDGNSGGRHTLGDVYYLSGDQRNIFAHFWR